MIKQFGLFLILLLFCLTSSAQFYKQSQVDRLQATLQGQSGKQRIETLLLLSDCFSSFQIDSAVAIAKQAQIESKELNFNWGYYQGLFLATKNQVQTKGSSQLAPSLLSCSKWFKKNGFEKEHIVSQLEYLRCLSSIKPLEEIESEIELLFTLPLTKQTPLLQGLTWYLRYECQVAHYIKSDYIKSLDSAKSYFTQADDSLMLLNVHLKKIEHSNFIRYRGPLHKALRSAQKWENNCLVGDALGLLTFAYGITYQLDSAIYFGKQHLSLATQYGSKAAKAYANYMLGAAHKSSGQTAKSISYFKRSSELNEALEAYPNLYECLKSLGSQNERLKDYFKAIDYYVRAMEVAKILNNPSYIYFTKASLAKSYTVTKEYDKAEQLLLETIDFIQREMTGHLKKKMNARMYELLADVYQQQGKHEQALEKLEISFQEFLLLEKREAIRIAYRKMSLYLDMGQVHRADSVSTYIKNQSNSFYETSQFLLQEGRLHFLQERYALAIETLNAFIKKTQQGEYSNDRSIALQMLYESAKELQKYPLALSYLEEFKTVDDSIKKANEVEGIQLIQSKYEVAEKEADLLKVQQENQLQELTLQRQEDELAIGRLYIFILVLLILLIGAVVFWRSRKMALKKEKEAIRVKAERLELKQEKTDAQQKVELSRLKDELFANVSHELRTPLTLILVPIKNLLKKAQEEDRPIFKSILNSGDQLLQLVDEILELSRLESGHTSLQQSLIDLEAFSTQLKSNFTPLFSSKHIEFKLENAVPGLQLMADPNRLKMVLNNLLKNAFHHCPSNGEVAMHLDLLVEAEHRYLCISVSNTGQSISDEQTNRIFHRFFRAREQEYTGSGIGLALSRQIVELHQGTIEVDNSQPDSTIFKIVLPGLEQKQAVVSENQTAQVLNGHEENSARKVKSIASTDGRSTLLIVEDNLEMQTLLKKLLGNDFRLWIAADGEEGEKMAIEHQPQLILSDVMMPNKDGFELLQAIKTNIHTSHIPVVLLTARADNESRIQGFEQDADEYIGKPFDPDALLSRIHNLLRQRQQLQKLFIEKPMLRVQSAQCTSLDQDFIHRAQEIVGQFYQDGSFTVEQFCKELALNRNSVHNKLKSLTSQSASQFIQTFRLTKAAELLGSTNENINAVATDSGFNNRQAFNKGFRKHFGMTPGEYRKKVMN